MKGIIFTWLTIDFALTILMWTSVFRQHLCIAPQSKFGLWLDNAMYTMFYQAPPMLVHWVFLVAYLVMTVYVTSQRWWVAVVMVSVVLFANFAQSMIHRKHPERRLYALPETA